MATTKARTDGKSLDERLRRHGWRIWARPKHGPPLWKLGIQILPEDRAIQKIDEALLALEK